MSYSGVVLLIRIGVVEGGAERARSVEIEVVEGAVGLGGEDPIASLPSVPPQLQLVRLCLYHPHGTGSRQQVSVKMKHTNIIVACGKKRTLAAAPA